MTSRRSAARGAWLFVLVLGGCHGVGAEAPADAPIGILLEGRDGAPSVEVAVTARPLGLDEQAVQPLAGALHQALLRCDRGADGPALEAALAHGLPLSFAVEARGLSAHGAVPGVSACLAGALEGLRLPATKVPVEQLELELRAGKRPESAAREGQRAETP